MVKSALVIGGTGPTGPSIVAGLLERGFDVSTFHRGTHEPPDLPEVQPLPGDVHPMAHPKQAGQLTDGKGR